jgi:flagellar basal body L-ring protein FlgH
MEHVSLYTDNRPYDNTIILYAYLDEKVGIDKQQDKKAKKTTDEENYITVDWLMNSMKSCCSNCSCSFNLSFEGGYVGEFTSSLGKVTSNFTADRIRCDEDHNLDNIVPMCCYCNCSKSDK